MKVTAEKIPQSKVLLRIEIPPEQVQQAIDKTYRDVSRRVRIPGFRPGKAPRPIVERYVGGPEAIQEEGVERLIDDSFRKALVEADVHPIGEADVNEKPEYHPGEPVVFEAVIPVAPTVELGDYQNIRLEPVAVEATPEQVNRFIDGLLEGNADWVTVERGAQNGDHVVIDVVGTAGTVPTLFGPGGETLLHTEGGREVYNDKDHEHLINTEGPPVYAPGFDEELIGLTAGSDKTFGLTLPVDFPDPDLANKSIVFAVKVHEVKEKHLPELNDEFAKKVEGGDTVEELRENVRKRIQVNLELEARAAYNDALVEAAVNRATVEMPDVMVERQIDAQMEDLKADLAREKVSWADFLLESHKTQEQVRAEMHDSARRRLVNSLVLREIARHEGIEVKPEDVTAEIDDTAAQFGPARQIIRDRLNTRDQREQIESRLAFRKTVERLAEIAQQPAPPEAAAPEGESKPTETASSAPEATTAAPPEAAEESASATTPASTEASVEAAPSEAGAESSESESSPSTEKS